MESFWRWLSIAKGRRLIHVQMRTKGVRARIRREGLGGRWNEDALRAVQMPKRVWGMTIVLKSLRVKR